MFFKSIQKRIFNYSFLINKLLRKGAFIMLKQRKDGGIAQLGEHLPCKQGVSGSIPLTSTPEMESRKPERKKRTE